MCVVTTQVDWCFGDETVDRLCLNPAVDGGSNTTEGDPTVGNHNLLLGNIHKVEGKLHNYLLMPFV